MDNSFDPDKFLIKNYNSDTIQQTPYQNFNLQELFQHQMTSESFPSNTNMPWLSLKEHDHDNQFFAPNYALHPIISTDSSLNQKKKKNMHLCDFCNKVFRNNFDLKRHIRVHTGDKPYNCTIDGCNKKFNTSNILKIHMRKHTGERPYNCSYCDKNFTNSTKLKNHVRTHTGERPYICSVCGCGKSFAEYSSLSKHQLVHSQKNKYPIPVLVPLENQPKNTHSKPMIDHFRPSIFEMDDKIDPMIFSDDFSLFNEISTTDDNIFTYQSKKFIS